MFSHQTALLSSRRVASHLGQQKAKIFLLSVYPLIDESLKPAMASHSGEQLVQRPSKNGPHRDAPSRFCDAARFFSEDERHTAQRWKTKNLVCVAAASLRLDALLITPSTVSRRSPLLFLLVLFGVAVPGAVF
jgi:hypothetical protein